MAVIIRLRGQGRLGISSAPPHHVRPSKHDSDISELIPPSTQARRLCPQASLAPLRLERWLRQRVAMRGPRSVDARTRPELGAGTELAPIQYDSTLWRVCREGRTDSGASLSSAC